MISSEGVVGTDIISIYVQSLQIDKLPAESAYQNMDEMFDPNGGGPTRPTMEELRKGRINKSLAKVSDVYHYYLAKCPLLSTVGQIICKIKTTALAENRLASRYQYLLKTFSYRGLVIGLIVWLHWQKFHSRQRRAG